MDKYLQVFKISFQQEFVYRVNFVMWRIRNVAQILLVFFLWDTVFSDPDRIVFGYDRAKILTYVLGPVFVKAFVLSARAVDVAGEVSQGTLSNYLVKPVNYFKYWLVRDISSKVLNLTFALIEMFILFLLLKPSFYIQTNILSLLGFVISVVLAMFIYFTLIFINSSVPFWIPEAAWGVHFLIGVVFVEFLSGALFPLDLLPSTVQTVLNFTPFPYLIFFPLQVYLGNVAGFAMIKGLLVCGVWVVLLFYVMSYVWRRGLKVYQAYGR
jgi:ABC-2 type transport system permease protein